MKIKSIVIYPIKGMKGIKVQSAQVLQRGFADDRRYMLVDSNRQFISQRTHPHIALFEVSLADDAVIVKYQGASYSFKKRTITDVVIKVQLFEHLLDATLVDADADRWFSQMLGEDVRLVKMTADNHRSKKLIKGPHETEVSFADGYPYLIVGTASLDRLNSRLDNVMSIDRFRANIIVTTETPHQEDDWEDISIGDVKMTVVKPCARCQVITIDQQTAVKGKQPLTTLSKYRARDHKIFFGANAVSRSNGVMRVGDEVTSL